MTNFSMNILLFGISGGEILVIMMLVLLLFGPKKIPEIARMVGRGMNEFKKVQREINSEITRYSSEVEKQTRDMQAEIDELVIKEPAKPLPAARTEKEKETEQQEEQFPKRDNLEDPRQVNDDLPYPYNQLGKD